MTATPSSADPRMTRRDLLGLALKGLLAAGGLLGLAGLLRFLGHPAEPPRRTTFDLGPAADYPPGSRTPIPDAQAVLLHTPAGFEALSLVCPHLGCIVEPEPDGFACPCHGSRYDAGGGLLRGPSPRGLQPLRVVLAQNGHLILDTTTSQ